MYVIQLPNVLQEYLVHVIEKHAASGIHPEEGLAIAKLWEAVTKNATHIDDAQVKAMATAGAPLTQSPVGLRDQIPPPGPDLPEDDHGYREA